MPQKQSQSQGPDIRHGAGTGDSWVKGLLAGYTPLPGLHDEMMRPDRTLRAPWDQFLGELTKLGQAQLAEAAGGAERHLKDSGVFYRVYDDPAGGERTWPLAPIPLLIDAAEWAALSTGVIQRARLAEAILRDIYGDGQLIRRGLLPAAAVTGTPDYVRPLVGVPPVGGRHLRHYAVDIGRGPDGNWWVLSDRTQAPSGAGYAVENRIALSRALPDVARNLKVERLASYFQTFRDELARLNARAEARVALLSPGPLNETYFEHAYLARYLGFLLVEGADLTVRDGAVYVRTVSGLKRVDVLLRRLDGDFADPLELRTTSRLGVPGLVQAIRDGGVTIANALGSGVMESRALMGFLPALARHVLGEELTLPNVATWWCGQPREREAVLAGLGNMAIAHAFGGTLPAVPAGGSVLGSGLTAAQRTALAGIIAGRGMDVVGQEAVKLSTMPVWADGRLTPRPFVLRLFVAAVGEDDWTVMPGGFCRISGTPDARFVSLQQGASASDVWVLSNAPVAETTLLPPPDRVRIRRTTGTLPSRAADNLFWLSRYLERSEATLRVVRALVSRVADTGPGGNGPVIRRLADLLAKSGALPEATIASAGPARLAMAVMTHRSAIGALPALTAMARNAAGVIRDRLAPDAFQTVTDIARRFEALDGRTISPAAALDEANAALRQLAAFAGLASENMNRAMGWRFLELGRRIERADGTARFVRLFADDTAPPGALDAILELGDSQITYRSRYVMTAARHPAVDLIVLDENNSRSVAFQVARIVEHLEALPATTMDGRPIALLRAARRFHGELAATAVEDLAVDRLESIISDLYKLSEAISLRFFTQRPSTEHSEEFA
jgi:uncharacterized circularly permuted ATP-grasp superfamily protein/uncharacterized alpha-E superfamily protein